MFVAPQFSIRTLMLAMVYVPVLMVFGGGHYVDIDLTILGVWLVPVILGAIIRPRWLLATTCVFLNFVLYLLARTIVFATWKQPGYEAISHVSNAFFLGAYAPAPGLLYGKSPEQPADIIITVATAAVLYALVGVGFSYYFPTREPRRADKS